VAAGKDAFERLGWSGATMRGVAGQAGVSVKTVEPLTAPWLSFSSRPSITPFAGDLRAIPILEHVP